MHSAIVPQVRGDRKSGRPLQAVQAPLLDRLGFCHDAHSQGLVGRYALPVKKKKKKTQAHHNI